MTERKRLHLDVYDIEALKAKYPQAVKQVVIVKEDHTELYKFARAHVVTGEPIPGVLITKPDGTTLGSEGAIAHQNAQAKSSALKEGDVVKIGDYQTTIVGGVTADGAKPEDYLSA